jgi:hypothetical protein
MGTAMEAATVAVVTVMVAAAMAMAVAGNSFFIETQIPIC